MKNRLRDIRVSRSLSLDEVGVAVGKSGAQVSRHEMEKRPLYFEDLLDYAAFYNVGIDEIVDVPLSGKGDANYNALRMETALGYIVEACDKHKLNADVMRVKKWAETLYADGTKLRLTPKLMKDWADHIIQDAKKNGHPPKAQAGTKKTTKQKNKK